MVGGIRDAMLFGDFKLLYGFVAIFVVVLAGNLITGNFHFGFSLQPIAHSSQIWNGLGMVLVGWGSVLLGGCPLRQLILAGEGNADSAVTVFGMIAGAALAHNFGLAGNPDSLNEAKELVVGGISTAGKVAVVLGLVIVLVVSLVNMPKSEKVAAKSVEVA
jgi:YedE family putative selenium metabolism protein